MGSEEQASMVISRNLMFFASLLLEEFLRISPKDKQWLALPMREKQDFEKTSHEE